MNIIKKLLLSVIFALAIWLPATASAAPETHVKSTEVAVFSTVHVHRHHWHHWWRHHHRHHHHRRHHKHHKNK